MEPVIDVFVVGVNVAVYDIPLPLKSLIVPPTTVILDEVNLVVDVFNVKVTVDVVPIEKVVLLELILQVIVVGLVFIVRFSVFDEK
jgi:hypothetical protein